MSRLRVAVLGASGFIGRRVVLALAATGRFDVLAISRNIRASGLGPDVQALILDARNPTALSNAISGVSGIVSCIAGSARDIVTSATALVSSAATMPRPPRLVYLSSLAAYGSARGVVTESNPLWGDLGDYSAAKAAADRLLARYSFAVRLRPGIVYGPESTWWSDRIARLLVTRRLGDLGDAGAGTCNLVHVDDVAAAAVLALETEAAAGEAFNVGNPTPPTWNEYFSSYADALEAGPARHISESRLGVELALVGPVLRLLERTLGTSKAVRRYPAIRPWLTRLCRHDIRMNVSKIERLLGIRWRSLQDGLRQTAEWFQKRNVVTEAKG